jgi:tetratricopeptide (TPR) repeat protein
MLGSAQLAMCHLPEAAASLSQGGPAEEVDRPTLIELGAIALYDQDTTLTIDYWERGGWTWGLLDLGSATLAAEDWEHAAAAYGAALAVMDRGDSADSNVLRASAMRGQALSLFQVNGDLREGLSLLRQALEMNPRDLYAMVFAGDLCREGGDLAQARQWYVRAGRVAAGHWLPVFRLGVLAQSEGQPRAAVRWYTQAIEMDPEIKQPYLVLGDLYRSLGEGDTAAAVYQAGMRRLGSAAFRERLSFSP